MGKSKVVVRSEFGLDLDANSNDFVEVNNEPSMTRQSEREDADINTIVRRFGITGQMPENHRALSYGDFTHIDDFQSAFAAVADAQEHFMAMPADVRTRFANDPQKFLEFCSDGNNRDEMKKLGLLVPETIVPPPVKVEIANAEFKVKPAEVNISPKE